MSDSPSVASRPTESELDLELAELVNWQRFVTHLPDLTRGDIEQVEQENHDVQRQKLELFRTWLRRCPNASWNDIVVALEKSKEITLANVIKMKFISSDAFISRAKQAHDQVQPSSNQGVYLFSEEKVVDEIQKLHRSFTSLATDIRCKFDELVKSGKSSLRHIAAFIQEARVCGIKRLTGVNTIDELFDAILPHNGYLDCELLEIIVEKYLDDDDITKVKAHTDKVKLFKRTTPIKTLKNKLQPYTNIPNISDKHLIVTIKLQEDWGRVTLESIEKLVQNLLQYQHSVRILKVDPGSISVMLLLPKEKLQHFIVSSSQKLQLMRLTGIFRLQIGAITIFEERENKNFTFESAFLESSQCGDDEAVQFLLGLGVNVNFRNSEGQTALLLAREAGQDEIVQILLSAGAEVHLDGYKELMQQRSEKEQLQIQVEELKTANEDSKMKLLELEALLNDRKLNIEGTFSSKQSTSKELARQTAEIEDLRKKLNRETEEKTILQDEMTTKDALLQNIKEPTQSNREATHINNQDINILSKLTKPERRNGKLHWRNHGLTIFNLKDSYTSFSVATVWSSQFEFPENTELFSHIYWIQIEGEPVKPVEVEMQHCGVLLNEEQCSNMCFGVSNDPENGPPYKFEIQEGHFTPDSNYGKVEIKFSRRLIAIFFQFIRRFLPENRQNVVNTIGKKYFTKWYLQNSNPSKGRVHFVICQNLEGCIENADEYYTTMHSMRSGPQCIIHAKPSEEKIQLVLQADRNGGVPIEDETEHDGWKITPTVVPVEVKLNDVDECSKYEKYHCLQIHTEKTNIRANLPPLKITLQGIEDTKTYFLKHDEVFDESEKHDAAYSSRKTVGNQKIWNQKFFIAAVIFGLIAVCLLLLFSSPDKLHTRGYWTLNADFTENELLNDGSIRYVTKPILLCICLKTISYNECQQIEREHKNEIRRQTSEVLSKWYRSHYLNPTWKEVVIALYCSDHIKEAKELAKRKNVDTTLLDDEPIM